MTILGIDLGTTNTVACIEGQILEVDDAGSRNLPSVVAFLPNGAVATGHQARRRRAIDGLNTIFSSKRIIGRRFGESATRRFCEHYPFDVVDAGGDRPAFRTRAGLHSPTDIASILLGQLRERAASLGEAAEVVIAVPTGFREDQREATLAAARQAGFDDLRLVDEARATACAYRSDPDVTGKVAVYDLGGGTFDVSILECSGPELQVLARASDPFLGGDDIDRKLADWVAREVLKQQNWDLTNYSEVEIRLLAECERAKIRLASATESRVDISKVDPECPLSSQGLPIRRKVLEDLCQDLVRRSFTSCDEALHKAGVRPGDVRAVLLAGGTTQLPMVQQAVEAYFGRTGLMQIEPTEVVALGASRAF